MWYLQSCIVFVVSHPLFHSEVNNEMSNISHIVLISVYSALPLSVQHPAATVYRTRHLAVERTAPQTPGWNSSLLTTENTIKDNVLESLMKQFFTDNWKQNQRQCLRILDKTVLYWQLKTQPKTINVLESRIKQFFTDKINGNTCITQYQCVKVPDITVYWQREILDQKFCMLDTEIVSTLQVNDNTIEINNSDLLLSEGKDYAIVIWHRRYLMLHRPLFYNY